MKIAILLFDDITALDAVGPYEVLSRIPGATVSWVASTPGLKKAKGGLSLMADHHLDDAPECIEHRYTSNEAAKAACEECKSKKASYDERVIAFGKHYLTEKPMTQEEMEAHLSKDIEWDLERTPLLDFVKQHKI